MLMCQAAAMLLELDRMQQQEIVQRTIAVFVSGKHALRPMKQLIKRITRLPQRHPVMMPDHWTHCF